MLHAQTGELDGAASVLVATICTMSLWWHQVMEDISSDYAKKTATLDPFPHASISAVGIHPCKHAETMKRLSDAYSSGGGKKLLVDQCARL